MRPGHLSDCVGHTSRRSEETVKNLELHLWMWLLLLFEVFANHVYGPKDWWKSSKDFANHVCDLNDWSRRSKVLTNHVCDPDDWSRRCKVLENHVCDPNDWLRRYKVLEYYVCDQEDWSRRQMVLANNVCDPKWLTKKSSDPCMIDWCWRSMSLHILSVTKWFCRGLRSLQVQNIHGQLSW